MGSRTCVVALQLPPQAAQAPAPGRHHGRRRLLLALPLVPLATLSASGPASAERPTNREVDAAESPMIQEMLRRTAEKKDERAKQRLDDYYRRNYKDYFEFEMENVEAGNKGKMSQETQDGIKAWLEANK